MKLEHIVGVAVRLFSIALAIYALRNGMSLIPYFQEQGWQSASYVHLALMLSFLFVSMLLWQFPLTVAKGLVKFKDFEKVETGSASADEVQVIGFTVLGMYLLFHVLSDLVYWFSIFIISNRNKSIHNELSAEQMSSMVATGVELIFVLFLLVGARGVVQLIRRLRYGEGA